MSNLFWIVICTSIFIWASIAQIDVPYCLSGQTDPATGLACTIYGYDATWEVTRVVNNSATPPAQYLAVNGIWPPPTVNISINQRIRIKLVNHPSMTEEVTLHFHGLLQQNGYNVMDGPQGVVQSPVIPGQSFIYDFPVDKAGTYWIHSHATGQYPKGLRSPLIVRDSSEPASLGYDVDKDYLVTVSDWYRNFWDSDSVYQTGTCGGGVEPAPTRIMVGDDAQDWGHRPTGDDNSYFIGPTMKARFRFVNLGAFARFYIHFSDYRTFEVVEVDGVKVGGTFTKGIELSSGQRVSIVAPGAPVNNYYSARLVYIADPHVSGGNVADGCQLVPSNPGDVTGSEVQTYWSWIDSDKFTPVRNLPNLADFNNGLEIHTWKKTDTYSKPYYNGRPKLEFTIDKRQYPNNGAEYWLPSYAWNFNDVALVPMDGQMAWMVDNSKPLDSVIHTLMLVNDTAGHGTMGLSTVAQNYPTVPFPAPENSYDPTQATRINTRTTTLLRALKSGNTGSVLTDPTTYSDFPHTVVLNTPNEVHWFVLRSQRGDHPIHMHGHEFQILAKLPIDTNPSTGNPYNFDYNQNGGYYQDIYNKIVAINAARSGSKAVSRRDTLMIEKGWDYVIAITADNPGVWAMHCHNDFHASTGMFMQLVEQPSQLRSLLGTWSQDTKSPATACTNPSGNSVFQPVYSLAGANTQTAGIAGALWAPWAQVVSKSMGYYGVPEGCFWLVGAVGAKIGTVFKA